MSASLKSPATLFVLGVFLIMTAVLPAPRPVSASSVLYAAPTATGSADCSSWANACTLQTALTNATSGNQIWVRQGVHRPGSNQTDTFTLKNGVAVYGGFAGTETSLNQRDWQTNVTVLSGDIDQDDITDANGVVTSTANIAGVNAYHVVTGGGTNNTAVLDGFVITSGNANSPFPPDDAGGGMYNNNSSPTLRNLIFSGNAANSGGGMANLNSSNPTLTNVTFSGNAAGLGGGMYNENSSNPTLTNVTFSGNAANSNGGGMFNQSSSPTLTNVAFIGNTAVSIGGGMDNIANSSPTLTNVIFSGNAASVGGGGMGSVFSSLTLTNVTFSGNTAGSWGGGMEHSNSNSTLTNVIMWGNTAPSFAGILHYSGTLTVTYSNIQDIYSGTGNINSDPLFVDADGPDNIVGTLDDNLRLQSGSPSINTGNNAAVPTGVTTDLEGKPRIQNGTVDMGAYEYDNTPPTVVSITRADPDPTNAAVVTFTVTFTEAVTGVGVADFALTLTGSVSGASVTGVSGSGAVYTVTVSTGTGDGTLRLDIPNTATITDLAGNNLSGLPFTGGQVYTVDKTAPGVTAITRADPNPTNAASVTFVVTFTEAVTGVGVADFALTVTGISGASVTGVSGSGAIYTVTVSTGTGNGTLRLDIPTAATITDLAGNNLSGLPYTGGQVYTVDKTAPGVTAITRADPNPTNAASVTFVVTFTEAVTGVGVADFALTVTGGISGASVTGVSGSGAVYTVTVSTGTGDGTLRLDIPTAATITDLAGNNLSGLPYTGGQVYTVDKTAPGVTMTSSAPNPTNSAPIPVTVTFSEPVTGFTAGDIAVSNGSVSNFAGGGASYTFDLIPAANGPVTATIAANVAVDAVGNGNTAASFSRTYDTTAPGVTAITRADPNPTNAASVNFIVTFTEAVTGVGVADFALTLTGGISGASVTGVSGSGAVYTVTVSTGTGNGTLRLDIPNTATITDLAGNALSGLPYTGGQVYTVDKTAPGVTAITRADPNPTSAASVNFIVTFTEAVTGVGVADFALTLTGGISGASVTGVSGSGAVYTVTVSTGTGNGTLRLDIPNTATITDLAGNALSGLPFTGGETYQKGYRVFLPLIVR
jgi:hypothetical protein